MVKLITLAEDHLPFLLEVRNDPTTRFYLENDLVFNLDQCKAWFKSLTSPWYLIEENDIPLGYLRTNGSTVGCDIHPNHRRKGYARQAYLEYLNDKQYADLWVFEDNFAKDLYSDLGFRETSETKIIRNRLYVKMEYIKQ